jgi:hypothetical protein
MLTQVLQKVARLNPFEILCLRNVMDSDDEGYYVIIPWSLMAKSIFKQLQHDKRISEIIVSNIDRTEGWVSLYIKFYFNYSLRAAREFLSIFDGSGASYFLEKRKKRECISVIDDAADVYQRGLLDLNTVQTQDIYILITKLLTAEEEERVYNEFQFDRRVENITLANNEYATFISVIFNVTMETEIVHEMFVILLNNYNFTVVSRDDRLREAITMDEQLVKFYLDDDFTHFHEVGELATNSEPLDVNKTPEHQDSTENNPYETIVDKDLFDYIRD